MSSTDPASLRVLVVNWLDRENPRAGGAETHLHEIFGRLVDAGHRVTLLCSGFAGAESRTILDGIEVHRTGGRYTFSLAAPFHYRGDLAERPFDVVVEDLNKVPLFTPFWVEAPPVLLVHHLFGTTAFREASFPVAATTWMLELLVPRAFRNVPTVAVSESTARDLARRGMDRDGISVIPNGVDLEGYRPADPPGADDFPEPTLLYLGRLKRYKRVDLVVRAVDRLRDRGVDCRLVVAGKGDRARSLHRLRDRLDLRDRIEFPGFVGEDRKRELLRRSWVHVLTSEKEGWGITNLEAAASGTPTVASDAPGLRDSVRDGETGFLVPHGDVEALADRLQSLLARPELRSRMAREARRFAENFSWDASARSMERFLLEAC